MVGGLHPVVASQQDAMFVTNNCNLNNHSLWLITGPNMGGMHVLSQWGTGVLKSGNEMPS